MILTSKLLMEKGRMWPDRLVAMIKLDIRKAFDQLYRSSLAPALEVMRQKTGGKVMPVVDADRRFPRNAEDARGRPESVDPFRARALPLRRTARPKMVRLRFLSAFHTQITFFLAAGAAWKLTRMLSELAVELARLAFGRKNASMT